MRRKPSGAAAAHSGYAVSRVIQALEALVEGPISATVLPIGSEYTPEPPAGSCSGW